MLIDSQLTDDGKMILTLQVNSPPTPSASGKTNVVASSHGNKPTEMVVDGKKVVVTVNAFYYPETR